MTSRDAPVRWTDPVDALGLEPQDGPWDAAPIMETPPGSSSRMSSQGAIDGATVPSRNRPDSGMVPSRNMERDVLTVGAPGRVALDTVPVDLDLSPVEGPLVMGVPAHLMAMAVCAAALFGATSGMIVERLLFGA